MPKKENEKKKRNKQNKTKQKEVKCPASSGSRPEQFTEVGEGAHRCGLAYQPRVQDKDRKDWS